VPTLYDGRVTAGIYQPTDSTNKFRGPVKLRRMCYNSNNKLIFKDIVKDRKPNVINDANDPAYMMFGYQFGFDFDLSVDWNFYCLDELWVKKSGRVALGDQFYYQKFEADGFDCSY
jgi:hypothetical protein